MDHAASAALSDVAIVLVDRNGTIQYWNQAAQSFFGYAATAVIGQQVSLLVPPQYRDRHERGFADAVSTGTTRTGNGTGPAARLPVLCADGTIRRFPGRQVLITDPSGDVVAACGVFAGTARVPLPAVFPVEGDRASAEYPDLVDET